MKRAKEYNSSVVNEILSQTSEKEEGKISNKMRLAAKIADAMKTKAWNNTKLMEKMGRKAPSIISKWLSGTHNFTIDTLSELEQVLGIELLNLEEKKVKTLRVFHIEVSQTVLTSRNKGDNSTISNAVDMSQLFSNEFEDTNQFRA